ncbi:MAG: isomerase/hydrolase [Porticoccaceae bacterium]|nr:isomerase/hydrolase [Porticoccaceae bacterium]
MLSSDRAYHHRLVDGRRFLSPPGKVVCVGRNYAAHARELNNPVPESPLLFIKPFTAVVFLDQPLILRKALGPCHYETEMTVLIGKRLSECDPDQARDAIAGVGIGLDLTLRALQDQLKADGHPWEKAKAFDGSCALSRFAPYKGGDLQSLDVRLERNGRRVQSGNTAQMCFPVVDLLCEISRFFTLLPGDVVFTGTPEGVGALEEGDHLRLMLGDLVSVETSVTYC